MSGEGLASATRLLVLALSLLYGLAAVSGPVLFDFDTTLRIVLWLVFLGGGAALMLLGQLKTPAGSLSAVLISVGAVAGGLPLIWTFIVPVAVVAVITCSIALARRQASAPA